MTLVLLAFAGALLLMALDAARRLRDSLAARDVGLPAVDNVPALACAAGAGAPAAVALGRLA